MGFLERFQLYIQVHGIPNDFFSLGNSCPLSIIFNIHPIIQESYNTPLEHVNCLSDLFEN